VRASIVRRHHLDVERAIATVDVVLNPDVWELHMSLVVARQVVLQGPGSDLFKLAIRPAVTVAPVAIPLLEKLLILGLEFVLQDDAVDVRALVAQPLAFFEIGAIDLGVVLQLPGLLDAVVKSLAVRRVGVTPAGFQQVATIFGQRDGGRVATEPNGLNESRVAEVPQLAVARVEGPIELVAEVVRGHNAEGADGGQRTSFGTAQCVVVVV
jgi:hypothetical protein